MSVTRKQISSVMSYLGSIKTPRKAEASRVNGAKGGRPRKHKRRRTTAGLSQYFVFDVRKSIAATAYLCKLNKRPLDSLLAIRMLYYADRTAFIHWQHTITGDRFIAMRNGPALSRIYDLMSGWIIGPHAEAWDAVFRTGRGPTLILKAKAIAIASLSEREVGMLDVAFNKFKAVPFGEMSRCVREVFPEWGDPGHKRIPIEPRAILLDAAVSGLKLSDIKKELQAVASAKRALQRD